MDPIATPWWQSVTIWGVVITALAGLLGRYGVELAPDDEKTLAAAIVAVVTPLGILWGLVQAIWGRARAKTPLAKPGDPTSRASSLSALIAMAAVAATMGLGACTSDQATRYGRLALAVGEALYAIECKTQLVGQTGSVVVAVVEARDRAAATRLRAALAANDAMIAQACPLATAVDVVVALK